MTCRWELGPVCSVTPCCWDERLDTGQKTGTAFTVRTAFAKHQNICLTPLSKLCFSSVMITKTDNICFYLHCALEKNCFLSNFLRWRKTQSQSFPLWQFCWRAAHAGKLNHVCWHMIRLQAHKGRCHAVLCRHGSVSARCLDTQAGQSIRLHRKGDLGMKMSAGHTYVNEGLAIRSHLCYVYVNKENSRALIEYLEQTTTWVFSLEHQPWWNVYACLAYATFLDIQRNTFLIRKR